MGLTNRLATKVRTKPQTSAVGLTGAWEGGGELVAAAVVRAAAITLGQMGLRSSGFRGRDFLGINSARSSGASTVWTEQIGFNRFTIALGFAKVNYGRALDWRLDFTVVPVGPGYEVEVTTPAVSTHDGTQVHKSQYSEVRDLVLTGLKYGQWPNVAPEAELSQESLGVAQPKPLGLREGANRREFVAQTSLCPEDVEARLDLLPYRVTERGPGWRRLRVGMGTGSSERSAEVGITGTGDKSHVTVRYDIGPSGREHCHRSAVQQAAALPSLVLARLKDLDPGAFEVTAAGEGGS